MESERFSIPEVLFHPSDIGINQAGIVEATGEAIRCLGEASCVLFNNTPKAWLRSVFIFVLCRLKASYARKIYY